MIGKHKLNLSFAGAWKMILFVAFVGEGKDILRST